MKPVRCQPHPLYQPRPGQKSIRYTLIAGWFPRPLPELDWLAYRPTPPAVPVTDAEVADWRRRHRATCRDTIARLLTALEQEFGAAPARSGGPTA